MCTPHVWEAWRWRGVSLGGRNEKESRPDEGVARKVPYISNARLQGFASGSAFQVFQLLEGNGGKKGLPFENNLNYIFIKKTLSIRMATTYFLRF